MAKEPVHKARHAPQPAYRLLIWLMLSALTWGLGACGYVLAGKSWPNALYYSLQLFTLQMVEVQPIPAPLEWARWLSAGLAGYAVLRGALILFADRFQGLRAMWSRQHVVIAGLGWKARLFLQQFRKLRRTVVIVEQDGRNPYLQESRELGAIVLLGDASEADMLRRANIRHASDLLCLGDDVTNLKIMVQADHLVRDRRGGKTPLDCHVYLDDLSICRNLRPMELRPHESDFRQRFFSTYEVAAGPMRGRGIDLDGRHAPTHLVIVGLGPMGEALLLEAIHTWRMWNPDRGDGKKPELLRVTVVDPHAVDRVQGLKLRFPELEQFGIVTGVSLDEDSPQMVTCDFAFDQASATDAAYVCLEDEQLSLRTALRLNRRCEEMEHRFPIVVQLDNNSTIGELFQVGSLNLDEKNVHVFSLMESACAPEHLHGVTELIARTIHTFYLVKKNREGEKLRSKPALYPWPELEEKFRRSNLDQAEHMPEILRRHGYRIVRLHSPQAERFRFSEEEVEAMAREEHSRYQAFQVASAPKKLRQTWEQLSAADREFTLAGVRIWPAILVRAGFELESSTGTVKGKSNTAKSGVTPAGRG